MKKNSQEHFKNTKNSSYREGGWCCFRLELYETEFFLAYLMSAIQQRSAILIDSGCLYSQITAL